MAKSKLLLAVVFCCWLAMGGVAFAQTFEDSTVEFTVPSNLIPSAQFDFEFLVTNGSAVNDPNAEWIYKVDLTMPSSDYTVNTAILHGPDPLHPSEISEWEANFNPSTDTITWKAVALGTTASVGDIREGEILGFEFTAITDTTATDGFGWMLTGDGGTIVTGTAYIGEEPPDDDDDTGGQDDDDDDNDTIPDDSFGDNDDESDSGGCSC